MSFSKPRHIWSQYCGLINKWNYLSKHNFFKYFLEGLENWNWSIIILEWSLVGMGDILAVFHILGTEDVLINELIIGVRDDAIWEAKHFLWISQFMSRLIWTISSVPATFCIRPEGMNSRHWWQFITTLFFLGPV